MSEKNLTRGQSTSEFKWGLIAPGLIGLAVIVAAALIPGIPEDVKSQMMQGGLMLIGIVSGGYAVSRGIAKR